MESLKSFPTLGANSSSFDKSSDILGDSTLRNRFALSQKDSQM